MATSKLRTISFPEHPRRVTTTTALAIYKALLSLQIPLLNTEALIFKLAKPVEALKNECGFNSCLTDTVFRL